MQLNTELRFNILLILFCFYDTANDYILYIIWARIKIVVVVVVVE